MPRHATHPLACSSYSSSPMKDDLEAGRSAPWEAPRQGNCSTVAGIIVDQRQQQQKQPATVTAGDSGGSSGGLWKLIQGDESQYVDTGPHYPNSSTNFNSQVVVVATSCWECCRLTYASQKHCVCTAPHCTSPYRTALHCTALHCTALHCSALHCAALRCAALHCTALHCN